LQRVCFGITLKLRRDAAVPRLRTLSAFPAKEVAMRAHAFVLLSTTAVCLGLGVASATAGPCTQEIERVTKAMSARDAGSGPTVGAAASPSSGQSAGGQHPPTASTSQQAQGTAMSSQDARRQTQGEGTGPTDSQGAAGGTMDTGMAALQRARDLDGQGKEAECMASAQEAGRMIEKK
jgi:hypothetical protein